MMGVGSTDAARKKIEEVTRSEDISIGLTAYIGQKKSSISSSNLTKNNIKQAIIRCYEMAKNILSKKFKLNVWNRTSGKTLELQKKGAKIFKDIKDLVQNSKVIISMLANDNVCKAILIKKS